MKKRLMFFMVVVAIALCLCVSMSSDVYAASVVARGDCGASANWVLYSDGLLEITGSGQLYGFEQSDQFPWYSRRTRVVTLTIGEGITRITDDAFNDCSNLVSISFPNSLEYIGRRAFQYCTSLQSIDVPIHAGSYGISEYAFEGCTSLTSIVLEEGHIRTGLYAFRGCTSLTSVSLPETMQTINSYSFSGCNQLQDISLPNSVKTIDASAFINCSSLTSINIPNGVTSIGASAFSGCSSLTDIIIPNSVINIGSRAFSQCSDLENLTISESVTSIEDYTFNACTSLTSVTVPDAVTSIGERGFYGCNALTSIAIPKSVTLIGSSAFYSCSSLSDVYYGGESADWDNITIKTGNTSLTNATIHFTNPSGAVNSSITWELMEDGTLVLTGTGMMPSYVYTETDEGDLYVYPLTTPWGDYKDRITAVVIGEGITKVGDGAFWACTNIASVSLPSTCTEIGIDSFYKCTGLTEIVFPEGLLRFNPYSFEDCSGLTHLEIPGSVTFLSSAFINCTGLTTVTLSEGLQSLGGFRGCTSLSSINIPSTVTQIYSYAFYGCSSLTSVTIPAEVTNIGKMAFCECPLTNLHIEKGDDLRDIEVGAYAFSGNRLGSNYFDGLALSYDAWVIGSGDYQNHTSGTLTTATLTIFIVDYDRLTIHVPATRSGMCGDSAYWSLSSTGLMRIYGSGAMSDYQFSGETSPWTSYNSNIKAIEVDNHITRIGDYAFLFSAAESLTIKDATLSIGQYAFYYCRSLNSIDFGTGTILPGYRSFMHCDALESVHIPSNVIMKNVAYNVNGNGIDLFHHCDGLKTAVVDCAYVGQFLFEADALLETVTFTNPDVCFYYLENDLNQGNPFLSQNDPMNVTVIGPICSNVPVLVSQTMEKGANGTVLTYQQIEDDPGHRGIIEDSAVAATCEETGLTTGSHCTVCGQVITAQEPVESLGHNYSITYDWNGDNTSVTATAICSRNTEHVLTETVITTSEVTKEPTTAEYGETTYTAVFSDTTFATQTKTVADIPPVVEAGLYWRRPIERVDEETGDFYFVPNTDEEPVNFDIVGYGFGVQDREIFYRDETGQYTPLSCSELQFNGDCIEGFERQSGFVAIRYNGFGTGSISYETGGNIYSLTVRSELPSFGLYSSPVVSEETYLTEWVVTNDSNTIYLVSRDNATLTSVTEVTSNQAVITLDPSGTYATIQVTDPQESEFGVEFTYTMGTGSNSGDCWIDLYDRTSPDPGLYWRWPIEREDEETGEFYFVHNDNEVPTNEEIVGFGFGTQDIEILYCDEEGHYIPLDYSELQFSGECITASERQRGFITIRYKALGTGTVRYEIGREVYTLTILSTLPNIGFYSSTVPSEETYLTKWAVSEDNDTIYFVSRTDAVLTSVTEISSNGAVITLDPDGKYAAIQVTDPQERDLGIRFTFMDGHHSNDGTWWIDLIDDKPGLYWRWPLEETDETTGDFYFVPNEDEEPTNEAIVGFGVGSQDVEILYRDEAGTFTALSFSDLQFSGDCIEGSEWQPGFVEIRYKGLGTGSISYETGGQMYTLTILSELPDTGFYSSTVASEETYLMEWTVTADNNTVYFVARDDKVLTGVTEITSNGAVITLDASGKYAAIQVTDPQEDQLGVRFTFTNGNHSSQGTWWLNLIDNTPVAQGLYWRWPETTWEDDEPIITSNPRASLETSLRSFPYGDSFREFVYADENGTLNPVKCSQLTVTGDFFTIEPIQENYVILTCNDFGTGAVSYNGYSVTIESDLPTVGYYDEPAASQAHFIKEWVYDGTNDIIYIVANSGYTILEITDVRGSSFDVTLNSDGSYATAKLLELTDDQFIGVHYRVRDNYGGSWEDAIYITIKDNSVPVITGDADGDGKIGMDDRVLLSRYLAGWPGVAEQIPNINALDINKDGKVNAKDRMILSRYLAGWGEPYNSYFTE